MAQAKKSKKPESYQQVKKAWYAKLAKSGFVDIEEDEYNLKRYTNTSEFIDKTKVEWDARVEYWELVDLFLKEHTFKNELEKTMWMYYANGLNMLEITETLEKIGIKRHYNTIWLAIKRLEKAMLDLYVTKK